MKPAWQTRDGSVKLWKDDALTVLPRLTPNSVDALVTDPPYSSGGMYRGDRARSVADKYVQGGTIARAGFSGDNRDARSWAYWSRLWLSACLPLLKDAAYALMFTDWRQLPMSTDVFQAAGVTWRGMIAWDKGLASRAPHKGYFRHQCEYIVWGTLGACPIAKHGGPWPGCLRVPVLQSDKHHITGKPTALMEMLVEVVPAGATILDPFAGSGTTAVAAIRRGRRFLGIEQDASHFATAVERIKRELRQNRSQTYA